MRSLTFRAYATKVPARALETLEDRFQMRVETTEVLRQYCAYVVNAPLILVVQMNTILSIVLFHACD